ncbi:hypothetical protein P8A18_31820 [Streptomyces castrisilvae]|uniref:Uncharacterized protein n=1 Tax=Streptomyces castrisilvae TaxID=3033811 RepID=A0ABY9HT55_9ACTN|nr:hypothetical protein [Streptomyces sp. Mut1]WLQ37748.1 hypothetical protein P8A18_31820 [Streptomyces sp. Mut1]
MPDRTPCLEILMLCGSYCMVSYVTNKLRLPLETWAARFSQCGAAPDAGYLPL